MSAPPQTDRAGGRIYVAGPMRGYPEHNFPAFNAAAERFRAAGWDVRNPVEIGAALCANDPNTPGGAYLRADLREVIDCAAVALLPGWEASVGARCEVVVAVTIGLAFYDAVTMEPMAAPDRIVCHGGYERPPGAVDTLDGLADEIGAWQRATFPRATPHSVTEHLRREAEELCRTPTDAEEIADVFMLVVGAARAAGHDLAAAARAKLEKNKRRVWGTPDADGVVEHVAEGAAV